MTPRPVLLVVTGHPGSGKTTLATGVAKALGWPLFTKDRVKEALFDTLGVGDRNWSKRLGAAAMTILEHQAEAVLQTGGSVVMEANFDLEISTPHLRGLVARTGARAATVLVTAEPSTLVARYRERARSGERHPGHLDAELLGELEARVAEPHRPPEIDGPVLEVAADTPDVVETVRTWVSTRVDKPQSST